MSGPEVIDGISGLMTILEGPAKVYESARKDIQLSEAFEIVGRRLPVLCHILQICKRNLELYKDLSPDIWQALENILDACDTKARKLSEIFEKVISGPGEKSAWRKRYAKVVRRLGQGNKVDDLMMTIIQDVRLLVNNEAVMSASSSQNMELENILKEIQSLKHSTLEDEKRSVQNFHSDGAQINNVNNGTGQINSGSGQQINNNAPVGTQSFTSVNTIQEVDFGFRRPIGIYMGQAPCMPSDHFVGRDSELAAISKLLHPDPQTELRDQKQQQRLALAGTGGIGKTQIAVTYARTPRQSYQSVIWMNATSEATLKSSFESVAGLIFGAQVSRPLDEAEVVTRTLQWLSDPNNAKWLLIFDNYDDRGQFELEQYYPPVAHGAIIVTTRRPDVVLGKTAILEIKPLPNVDSLGILQVRSKREIVQSDTGAKQLLERLGGLPLALATAGAFLQRRPWSFERYLEEYEAKWNIDPRRPIKLQEYHERTLWTTWNISYDRLEIDDLEAAKMLRLLAYFGNQSLWYEYFCAGLTDNSPLHEVIGDETSFHGVMEVLSEYSFLEFHPNLRTWSMHTCVHDWTLATLNKNINTQCYWYALECAARSIRKIFRDDRGPYLADSFESLAFACLVPHAVQLCQQRFIQADVFANSIFAQLEFVLDISGLLHDQTQSAAGSMLLLSVLPHAQRILGPNHRFTLDIMSSIGWSYHQQLKFDKARQFLLRAVAKQEETLGLYNLSTISTIASLGAVYISQGNLDDATQILSRTIAVTRTTDSEWSAEKWACQSKLLEIHTNLAIAFMQQNKDRDAERILKDVISQREKIQGQTHLSTLSALSNLGVVYQRQGQSEDAERISRLVLASTDKFLSPAHQVTLACVTNLGETFLGQKRFKEAEHMFRRALAGYEDTLGPHHEKTLDIARRLGDLYSDKGDFHDAEQMYKRVLTWKEQALGLEHQSTIEILDNLACLYFRKGQMDDAEQMFVRALRGSELRGNERIGRQRSVSDIASELGAIYLQKSQLDKAEKMCMKALGGFQKEIDPNDSKIPAVAASLWIIYQIQGDWTKAERMRALAGSVINSLFDQAYL